MIDGAVSCQLYIQIKFLQHCSKLLLSRVKNRYQKKEGYLSNFKEVFFQFLKMAFTFAAFSYIVALIVDAFLIFFAIFHVSTVLYLTIPISVFWKFCETIAFFTFSTQAFWRKLSRSLRFLPFKKAVVQKIRENAGDFFMDGSFQNH